MKKSGRKHVHFVVSYQLNMQEQSKLPGSRPCAPIKKTRRQADPKSTSHKSAKCFGQNKCHGQCYLLETASRCPRSKFACSLPPVKSREFAPGLDTGYSQPSRLTRFAARVKGTHTPFERVHMASGTTERNQYDRKSSSGSVSSARPSTQRPSSSPRMPSQMTPVCLILRLLIECYC